jgi:hypothetical protein
MGPLGLPWECPDGAPRRTSMGFLQGPHKREKVKQYLTRDFRGYEVGPYLAARRSGKNAYMGPLEGPIGGVTRDPKGLYWNSS